MIKEIVLPIDLERMLDVAAWCVWTSVDDLLTFTTSSWLCPSEKATFDTTKALLLHLLNASAVDDDPADDALVEDLFGSTEINKANSDLLRDRMKRYLDGHGGITLKHFGVNVIKRDVLPILIDDILETFLTVLDYLEDTINATTLPLDDDLKEVFFDWEDGAKAMLNVHLIMEESPEPIRVIPNDNRKQIAFDYY